MKRAYLIGYLTPEEYTPSEKLVVQKRIESCDFCILTEHPIPLGFRVDGLVCTGHELNGKIAVFDSFMGKNETMTDDQNGRVTLPDIAGAALDIAGAEARLKAITVERDNWKEAYKDRSEPWKGWGLKPEDFGFERTWEQLRNDCLEARADRDRWRERFMVLRSRLHGVSDSLRRLDSELGRIIDEK